MPPVSPREHMAVVRALLAAIDAELDQIEQGITDHSPVYLHDQLWREFNGVCPECRINWDLPSPSCPRLRFNRHPAG